MMFVDDAKIQAFNDYRSTVEKDVLSICLLSPEAMAEFSCRLQPTDFCDKFLQELFRLATLMTANNQPVNVSSLMIAAKKSGLMDSEGGAAEWARLASRGTPVHNAEYYALELARLSGLSQIQKSSAEAYENSWLRNADPVGIASTFKNDVEKQMSVTSRSMVDGNEVIQEIYDSNDREDETTCGRCIPTGYQSLDAWIGGGFYSQDLVLLGGRFGTGKSGMAAEMVANAVLAAKSAIIFSMEMSKREFFERVLSSHCGISMNAWQRKRTGEEQSKIGGLLEEENLRWWIDDYAYHSIDTIQAACELRKLRDGLDLVVIDNLQLIVPANSKIERYQQLKAVTERAKKMAKSLDVVVLMIGQLDTDAGKRKPDSTSWAGAKAIEGDADIGMMIHDPDPQNQHSDDIDLIITKVRSRGRKGELPFRFIGEFQRFVDRKISSNSDWLA
jgi:replicative DNA helicase